MKRTVAFLLAVFMMFAFCSAVLADDTQSDAKYSITFIYKRNGKTNQFTYYDFSSVPSKLPDMKSNAEWYYDEALTERAISGTPLTGDITLYADLDATATEKVTDSSEGSESVSDKNVLIIITAVVGIVVVGIVLFSVKKINKTKKKNVRKKK